MITVPQDSPKMHQHRSRQTMIMVTVILKRSKAFKLSYFSLNLRSRSNYALCSDFSPFFSVLDSFCVGILILLQGTIENFLDPPLTISSFSCKQAQCSLGKCLSCQLRQTICIYLVLCMFFSFVFSILFFT